MGDIARGSVDIDHAQRYIADVGELVEDAAGDIHGLSGGDGGALFAEAHFSSAFDDKVDLFLLLIVPGDLAAIGFECDVSCRESRGLDGAGSADEILCAAASGVGATGDLGEIGDDHESNMVANFITLLTWQSPLRWVLRAKYESTPDINTE